MREDRFTWGPGDLEVSDDDDGKPGHPAPGEVAPVGKDYAGTDPGGVTRVFKHLADAVRHAAGGN
jgi:hypothetical protein